MPSSTRRRLPAADRPPPRQAVRRSRIDATAGACALFYSGTGLGIALLIYAGFFLSGPAPRAASSPQAQKVMANIRFNQGDGKGKCRQVTFDNASGRFAEGGTGPCPDLIPQELLIDTVRPRAILAESFNRAFK